MNEYCVVHPNHGFTPHACALKDTKRGLGWSVGRLWLAPYRAGLVVGVRKQEVTPFVRGGPASAHTDSISFLSAPELLTHPIMLPSCTGSVSGFSHSLGCPVIPAVADCSVAHILLEVSQGPMVAKRVQCPSGTSINVHPIFPITRWCRCKY